MIVIATYNGENMIKNLLSDIQSFNIPNEEVCIVDNMSPNVEYLKQLSSYGYKTLLNPYMTYQIGAYIMALDIFKSDIWFFLQDSIRIKENIFEMITPKLTDNNVYTFLTFEYDKYDNPEIRFDLQWHFQTSVYSKGLFGVMFFCKDSVIRSIKDELFIPQNKFANTFTERATSVVLDRHNIEIIGLDEFDEEKINIHGNRVGEGYPFFEKIFKARK
jgi:glycosyltransferase involved in cell wall biosynthesis